jgi:L-lactate dehydrogenase (cytochrome)
VTGTADENAVLKDELETSMRMLGVTDLRDLNPGYVNTLEVDHLIPTTEGHPYARARAKARL